jgi:hypothetical protein
MFRPNFIAKEIPEPKNAEETGDVTNLFWDSQDINAALEYVGFPKKYRKDVTAVAVISGDGDYDAVFISEDNPAYLNNTIFHPLAYYRAGFMSKKFAPIYWQEENPYYQKEV